MLAASALCLSSCGNYALYRLHVTTSAGTAADGNQRADIDQCRLTITDEANVVVAAGYSFPTCASGFTKQDLGVFSYSTSRSSGTLTFQVDGFNANRDTILQTGKTEPIAPVSYPPEIDVPLLMK